MVEIMVIIEFPFGPENVDRLWVFTNMLLILESDEMSAK